MLHNLSMMDKQIYEKQPWVSIKEEHTSTTADDLVVSIDSDQPNLTLASVISKVRAVIGETPKDEHVIVFVTTGNPRNDVEFWEFLYSYLSVVTTEASVQFDIMFRGVVTLDMLSVFRFKNLNVSVSETIMLSADYKSAFKFVADNLTKGTAIMSHLNPMLNAVGDTIYTIGEGQKFLTDLGFEFEIF